MADRLARVGSGPASAMESFAVVADLAGVSGMTAATAAIDSVAPGESTSTRAGNRSAARQQAGAAALATVGCRQAPSRDSYGRPVWPTGWTGSMSASSDVAVSVVRRSTGPTVGVDVEPLESSSWLRRLPRAAFGDDERSALCAARPEEVLALFTVKEAVFKAIGYSRQDGVLLRHIRPVSLGRPTTGIHGGPAAVWLAETCDGPALAWTARSARHVWAVAVRGA